MLVRTITAFVALPLFFLVVYFLPPYCLSIAIGMISVIAVYELLWRSKITRSKRLTAAGYLMAIFIIYLFLVWMSDRERVDLASVASTVFGSVVIPLFLSSIIGIKMLSNGNFVILIPFIAAWITDTGAYFTGVIFGKHKLAPKISPKKTIEGSVGGVLFCVLVSIAYGFVLESFFAVEADYLMLAISSFILSIIAQIGDLSMSVIKREKNIKDYGVIFPGHGGILDRFDSVLFTSPATYIILTFAPLVF